MGTNFYNLSIGTGDGTNLAYGLPLFPVIGTARAGVSNANKSDTIFDFDVTILFSRTKFHSYYQYLLGVLGPAIAFDIPASVGFSNLPDGQGGQVIAVLGDQQSIQAGLGCGLSAGAGFTLLQQFYLPDKWFSPWKLSWHDAFNLSVTFQIDVITLLIYLIKLLLSGAFTEPASAATKKKLEPYLKAGLIAAQAFSFWGLNEQGFGPNKEATATATFVIPIDFFSFIPALKAFNRAISKIVGGIKFGTQFAVLMPVTLELESFTVAGGQGSNSSAEYGPITYSGSTAVAKGTKGFNAAPDRLTTNVSYSTRFTVALELFFTINVCKLFEKSFTILSIDLLDLMNLPIPAVEVAGSVSSSVLTGCVLLPQLTMTFLSTESDLHYNLPANTVVTDIQFKAGIVFAVPWLGPKGQDTAVMNIETNPKIEGFPESITIHNGDSNASFVYTFQNGRIPTGDPANPGSTISPSATAPYRSYLVRASLPPDGLQPCADWEVTVPVTVLNRSLSVGFQDGTQAMGPPYNTGAAAELNPDQSKEPGKAVAPFVKAKYGFPYAPRSAQANQVPINIFLLDADRHPHNGSDVLITFDSGASANLSRPATVKVPLDFDGNNFTLEWRSTGPETNYSSLFFLILDAGGTYGQAEFWLYVWNWS